MDKKVHWEKIYATKANDEVSWYQPLPKDSLGLITNSSIELGDPIIDVGAGNSFLVDHLLKKGFTNITVLDISKNAINKANNAIASVNAKPNKTFPNTFGAAEGFLIAADT